MYEGKVNISNFRKIILCRQGTEGEEIVGKWLKYLGQAWCVHGPPSPTSTVDIIK